MEYFTVHKKEINENIIGVGGKGQKEETGRA
jgi:hypothetical protein